MTQKCPWCKGQDYDVVERDYDLDEYLCECNDCHCLFVIREEVIIRKKGDCEEGAYEEEDDEDGD